MNLKNASYFVVSLFLAGGIAGGIGLAQQPAPPATPESPVIAAQGEPFDNAFSIFIDGGSFLGVYAEDINKENMSRYGLRDVRGVGITGIVKDSPAEKAGLKKDDVILRFDNDSVTSVRKLTRLVSEVAPDQTVRLGISRGGAEQEVAVTIAKRNQASTTIQKLQGLNGLLEQGPNTWKWEGGKDGQIFAFGNNRRIGVSTTQLTKQLADYFGIADGKGVLVTSVEEDSPAAKVGIKAGDVITAVDGEKIEGAGDLARAINKKKDGDITLTVVTNRNQRSVTLTPKEGGFPSTRPTPTGNRRVVVVPRIELPTVPEMNIKIPRIELPVIPEINVNLPTVKVIKGVSQPI